VAEAAAAGFGVLVLTVDLPVAGPRERDLRSGFSLPDGLPMPNLPRTLVGSASFHDALGEIVDTSLTWRDLEWLRSECALPLVVKGILTSEDAALACDHGAAALVLSNHGGRQLDHGRGSMEVLPEVVAAVAKRAVIIVDGGFLRGTDVVKAIALGAQAVGVGRLECLGLAAAGAPGLVRALELLEDEIRICLGLLGVSSLSALDRSYLHAATPVGPAHVTSAFPLLDLDLERY